MKLGNSASFKQSFAKTLQPDGAGGSNTFDVSVCVLACDEDSSWERRRSMRDRLMEQSEKPLVFSNTTACVPDRQRSFYSGSDKGKPWTYIVMGPMEMLWSPSS